MVVIVGSQENINYAKHLITDLLAKTNHQGSHTSSVLHVITLQFTVKSNRMCNI